MKFYSTKNSLIAEREDGKLFYLKYEDDKFTWAEIPPVPEKEDAQ